MTEADIGIILVPMYVAYVQNYEDQFGKVAKAIKKIHMSYRDKLDVEQLAQEAGMSVPSFYAH